jgi:inositol transport system substrate-binding protein
VNLQVLDGQGSSPKQVADLENAITRGAQGFIVSPNDVNAVSSAVDEIQDAKLPIVTPRPLRRQPEESAALWR